MLENCRFCWGRIYGDMLQCGRMSVMNVTYVEKVNTIGNFRRESCIFYHVWRGWLHDNITVEMVTQFWSVTLVELLSTGLSRMLEQKPVVVNVTVTCSGLCHSGGVTIWSTGCQLVLEESETILPSSSAGDCYTVLDEYSNTTLESHVVQMMSVEVFVLHSITVLEGVKYR